MSQLIFLAIFAFIFVKRSGLLSRGKARQVSTRRRATQSRVRRASRAPDRFRDRGAPPPPTTPPLSIETGGAARPAPSVADPAEAVVEEVPPPPHPGDPVIIDPPEPTPEPIDEPDPAGTPRAERTVELDLESTIAALFGRGVPPHTRAALFESSYAGQPIEWTVTVIRSSRSRRNREPATQAELVLGYASERQLFSDRVVAEAFFLPEADLEPNAEITIRGVLTSADVYTNRLVLDDTQVVGPIVG